MLTLLKNEQKNFPKNSILLCLKENLRKSLTVLKVIEISANSTKSWEDATKEALKEASKAVKNISSISVQDYSTKTEAGKVIEYQVNVKITYEVQK